MSQELNAVTLQTSIWEEEPEAENPYDAAYCYCHGYDVFGDLLGQVGYSDYLYLLFKGEQPSPETSKAIQILTVALANPGPRDPSTHAAMAAGVGGSTAASTLMAALAVGAGSSGGSREIYDAMIAWRAWTEAGDNEEQRIAALSIRRTSSKQEIWPIVERPPGFSAYGQQCALPVKQLLELLAKTLPEGPLAWLQQERPALEKVVSHPLAITGVVAAAFTQIGFTADEAEMLFLLLRLPGAAAHALEQKKLGYRHFPFFSQIVEDDPDHPGERP